MNTLSLVLAAFVLSPANSGGLKPAISTGDSLTDWQTLASTASPSTCNPLTQLAKVNGKKKRTPPCGERPGMLHYWGMRILDELLVVK